MKKTNPLLGWTCILFALLLSNLCYAQVLFVDHSATGANDGTSWSNAFTDLSDALTVATAGDQIWLADGVYKPTVAYDFDHDGAATTREATFRIPNQVVIYGGFSGDESGVNERDFETNLSILSGDVDNNDINADGNFIAEIVEDIVGGNAYHVVATINVGSSTGMDGVIVTAGLADNHTPGEFSGENANTNGAGWYVLTHSILKPEGPTAANSRFQGNYAFGLGGAVYNDPSGSISILHIRNSAFIQNKGDRAGGIFVGGVGKDLDIENCQFVGNRAVAYGGALLLSGNYATISSTLFDENAAGAEAINATTNIHTQGGAVMLFGSNAFFNNCIFERNLSVNGSGGFSPIEGGGGGAVAISQENSSVVLAPTFINCGFYANVTSGQDDIESWGGAVVTWMRNSIARSKYINCVFAGNESNGLGGAIANFMEHLGPVEGYVPALETDFTNCTFVNNHAQRYGGAIYNDETVTGEQVLRQRLENCILWANSADIEGDEVYDFRGYENSFISYSIIQGSGGSGPTWNPTIGVDEGHNLDIDPAFQNITSPYGADGTPATNDDGLRLGISSVGLDYGNNAAAGLVGISTDYAGNARVRGIRVDRGAYEHAMRITLRPWRCASCPWVMTLLPLAPIFMWDGEGNMAEADDGKSTIITGKIVSTANKSHTFDVYLKLVNAADWETWRKSNRTILTYTPEASSIAKQTVDRWAFWELSGESYLKGTGSLTGQLTLQPYPADFKVGWQFGPGANGWDKDAGVSGLFLYQGTLINKNKKQKVKGLGSLNVDAEWCEKCLPPTPPNNILSSEEVEISSTKTDFIVFPTLAEKQVTIVGESLPADRYTVTLYDQNGQAKKVLTLDSEQGDSIIPLDNLNSGPYVIRLVSSRGEVLTKKIVVK